jgi:hypothetical protein
VKELAVLGMFLDFFENHLSRVQIPASSFFEKERTAQNWFILGFTQKMLLPLKKGFPKIVEFAHLWVLHTKT